MNTDKAQVQTLVEQFHYWYSYIVVDNEVLEKVIENLLNTTNFQGQVILDLARDEILSQQLAEEVVE